MTADDARAMAIFDRAVTLPSAERIHYTAQACEGDVALLARVRRLLEADARDHALLDRPPGALLAELGACGAAWQGGQIGPYQLLREIGRGGMGCVFLAERSDVGARVAVKIMADSLGSPERIARFEYERRVLAGLDHPHIARFLDAGVTSDGRPWLAMEYVDGSPIDEHADARCLTIPERVRLLELAAEAVAHAHRNLLVHRDIKPSNILVSDAGIPKLVDFGIAKLVEDGRSDVLTIDPNQRPMTLEYASPEQVRGDPVTTASDVYQLGIVLHELLTGRRPSDERGEPLRHYDRAAGVPMLRPSSLVRREVRPPQLSGKPLSRTARELSALRSATTSQLRRQVAGDLDTILAVALDPDPARRYRSAHEFAADLRRYRLGHAVEARAGSFPYRLRKFVRRHAIATALAIGLVAVLVVSMAVLSRQAHDVATERDRAEKVSGVLERLVRYAAPGPARTDSGAARAILSEVATEGLAGLRTEPEVWARILEPVASIYAQTGKPDTAMMLLRAVLAALDDRGGAGHPVAIQAMATLGITMVEQGDFPGGLAMLERMLGNARRLPPDRRRQFADNLSYAAFGRQVAGDDRGARRLYEETLRVGETLPDSGGRTYDRTLTNLAWLSSREGDLATAERLFRLGLARRAARDGGVTSGAANTMLGLSRVLIRRGSIDEAGRLADSAYAIHRRLLLPPHSHLADAMDVRATVMARRGLLDSAEILTRDALAMFREVYGSEHFVVAMEESNLAGILAQRDHLASALEMQRAAVARYRRTAGPRHPATLAAIVNLADLERDAGESGQAERHYREALAGLDSVAPGRPALARPLAGLGALLVDAGRCAEAEPYLRRALGLAQSASDSSSADRVGQCVPERLGSNERRAERQAP